MTAAQSTVQTTVHCTLAGLTTQFGRGFLRASGVALAALMLDCATLSPLPEGACGNGVVDANEDCDSFPKTCGRPGEGARACRLTCERGAAQACPIGWGCSVEGICRQATGSFEVASAPSSAGVVTLLAGDFDGDGRSDLFGGGPRSGASKPRIHFFDSSGALAAPVSIQFPMSTPVVRDFDGDGRDDLAYALNVDNRFGAVGVLAGASDRAFRSVLFPTYTRPSTALRFATIPFDPIAGFFTPNLQAALITVERTSAGTFFRTISGTNIVNFPELEQEAPFGPEQIVGEPVVARLFAPDARPIVSACGDVVFAYNVGDVGHLSILSPCSATQRGDSFEPRWQSRAPKDIVLPAKVTGPTLVADLVPIPGELDAYPEIFVTTALGTYVAVNTGKEIGPFAKLEEEEGPGGKTKVDLPTPLAIADMDGDGGFDVVMPTGLYVSGIAGLAPDLTPDAGAGEDARGDNVAARPATGRWVAARVGNFNGDALPDLVALSPEALELEFFANAGNSRFTRFSVPSPEPVRAITTGDFDGDRIQDIAFLASPRALGDETASGDAELLIAYGRSSGGPDAARLVGRFKAARGIASLRQVTRAIDEIVVFEDTPAEDALPSAAFTYVLSSGDRQAIAPLLLRDDRATTQASEDQRRLWLAASLVAAPLVTPGAVDLLSIAYGVTYRTTGRGKDSYVLPFPTGAWFAGARADASFDSLKEVFRFDPKSVRALDDDRFGREGIVETLIAAATADVDSPPDGVSEVVTLTRGRKVGTSDLLIVRKPDLEAGKPPRTITLDDFAVTGVDDELALFDLNADDRPDAVVLTRGKTREKLRVYLNDGAGGFTSTPLVFDPPRASDGVGDTPVAMARVVTGATDGHKRLTELAVVSQRRLMLARVNAEGNGLDVRDLSELLGSPSDGLTSVAGGDLDGDGVEDIAVAASGSIRVLRQKPRLR